MTTFENFINPPQESKPNQNRAPFLVDRLLWIDSDWKSEQEKLADLPYFGKKNEKANMEFDSARNILADYYGYEMIDEYGFEAPIEIVDPKAVIRAPSFKNWSDSYHEVRTQDSVLKNENSVIEIAKKMVHVIAEPTRNITQRINREVDDLERSILQDELVSTVEHGLQTIFKQGNIKLKRVHGPRGPIFFVSDGSHRIAAAKLAGLTKATARIGEYKIPQESKKSFWYELLALLPKATGQELQEIYDNVYPPNDLEHVLDEKEIQEAKIRVQKIKVHMEKSMNEKKQKFNSEMIERHEKEKYYKQIHYVFNKLQEQHKNILQPIYYQVALDRLNQMGGESFFRDYNGQMDEEGFLIGNDGKTTPFRVTSYDVGNWKDEIPDLTIQALRKIYPDLVGRYEKMYHDKISADNDEKGVVL